MKRLVKWVLAALCLFPAQSIELSSKNLCEACETCNGTDWDELLDRYEMICLKCIDLKRRKKEGQDISTKHLLTLLNQLEDLRKEIKDISDKMPAAARHRFYAIRHMYRSGIVQETSIAELPAVSKDLTPTFINDNNVASCINTSPIPYPPESWKDVRFVSVSLSAPELSAGVMAAYWGERIGIWAAARSTFTFHNTDYSAYSDGSAGDIRIWTSGRATTDRLSVTLGPAVRIKKNFALFAGAGYGYKQLCWEDNNGAWIKIQDLSHTGTCYEAGATFIIKSCALSVSWQTLPRFYSTAVISAGICF